MSHDDPCVKVSCLGIKGEPWSLQAKLDHGSSLCAKFHKEKCQTNKKIKFSQSKIKKNLSISPTTTRDIVKRLRESKEITVHVGQGREPLFNVLDL